MDKLNILENIKSFDVDSFIKNIRKEQNLILKNNKEKFLETKNELEKKGFKVNLCEVIPEYIDDYNYACGDLSLIISVEKEDKSIELYVAGESCYTVFDDERFFEILEEEYLDKGIITKDKYDFYKKTFYYIIKLINEQAIDCPNYDLEAWDFIMKYVPFKDEDINFINSILDQYCFEETYKNTSIKIDEIPLSWIAKFYCCTNNNWFSYRVYNEKKNEEISEFEIFEGNIINFLEDAEELYNEIIEK